MVTEAHLVLLVFPGLEQGNVKEVRPHSVAMVSLVKDEVIVDWMVFKAVGVGWVSICGLLGY